MTKPTTSPAATVDVEMTEIERLILQGLHIMMRTQQMPRGPGALDEHCLKLLQDMDQWGRDCAAVSKATGAPS